MRLAFDEMLTVPVYEKSNSRSSRVLQLQKTGPGSSQSSNNGSTANDGPTHLVVDRSTVLSFKGSAILEVGDEFEEAEKAKVVVVRLGVHVDRALRYLD